MAYVTYGIQRDISGVPTLHVAYSCMYLLEFGIGAVFCIILIVLNIVPSMDPLRH